jgi:hypothetical protein
MIWFNTTWKEHQMITSFDCLQDLLCAVSNILMAKFLIFVLTISALVATCGSALEQIWILVTLDRLFVVTGGQRNVDFDLTWLALLVALEWTSMPLWALLPTRISTINFIWVSVTRHFLLMIAAWHLF